MLSVSYSNSYFLCFQFKGCAFNLVANDILASLAVVWGGLPRIVRQAVCSALAAMAEIMA